MSALDRAKAVLTRLHDEEWVSNGIMDEVASVLSALIAEHEPVPDAEVAQEIRWLKFLALRVVEDRDTEHVLGTTMPMLDRLSREPTRQSAAIAKAREYHLIKMVAHAAHHVLDDSEYDEIREASLPSSVDELEAALNAWEAEFPDWHETMDESRAILAQIDAPAPREPARQSAAIAKARGEIEALPFTTDGYVEPLVVRSDALAILAQIDAPAPRADAGTVEERLEAPPMPFGHSYELLPVGTKAQLDALNKGVAAVRERIGHLKISEETSDHRWFNAGLSQAITAFNEAFPDQHLSPAAQPATEGE